MRRPRVLVVDDDAVTRTMVSKKLKPLADITEAENGLDALNKLEATTVDLAIVDLAMPVLDGTGLIASMRDNARLKHIPIIVLTANQTRDGLEEALRAGATSFLLKPLNWRVFGEHIRRVLDLAQHMSLHDHLTGLPSRTLLNKRLERDLNERAEGTSVAAYVLDLENFKHINDTLGHAAGDALLQQVSDRLRRVVRDTDTVARIGGDQFAIVQVDSKGPGGTEALARRLMDNACVPYELDGQKLVVNFTMGIAVAPAELISSADLIRHADIALHETKREGRGTYRLYESGMDERLRARGELERDLRRGVKEKEFELHYQPLVALQSGKISGFEALIRWRHPVRGLLQPGVFVPFAEEIGLIVQMSEWIIHEACAEATRWPGDTKVAVNISAAHFRDGSLLAVVRSALAASGLAPHRLELEITETSVLQNTDANLATLHQLRDLGVRIAMDDFGTGYSSLSYLQRFPFDKIKIDRSFVANIDENRNALNIVRAVAALANELAINTTAEGVETEAQLRAIAATGCKEVQGYYFSKPVPASGVPGLLEREPYWTGQTPNAIQQMPSLAPVPHVHMAKSGELVAAS